MSHYPKTRLLDATAVRRERATIEVFRTPEEWHPYPWRFAVTFQGVRHMFAGIPNQRETRRSASMRARWRAKWLEDGSFGWRYRRPAVRRGAISE